MLANFNEFTNIPKVCFIKNHLDKPDPGVKSNYGEIVTKCLEKTYQYLYHKVGMNLIEEGKQSIQKDAIVYNGSTNSKEYLDSLHLTIPYYNKNSEIDKSSSKVLFHKLLGDSQYLPKTVFDKEWAKTLKFPIVAKPNEGHSGVGIEVFDTKEDFEKSNNEFDLFSEKIDIDTEWRIVMFRDEVICVIERIGIDDISISSKKAGEELKFLYIQSDMNPFEEVKNFNELVKEIREHVKLDIWCVDLAVTGKVGNKLNNQSYILEINSSMGFAIPFVGPLYKSIYKASFGHDVPSYIERIINDIEVEYTQHIWEEWPELLQKAYRPRKC